MAYDPGELYYDPILTGFSVGFQDQQLYGEQLAPVTRVNTPSGRYRVFDRSNWIMYNSRREPQTVANEIQARKWSEDEFKTQGHSLQVGIADEEREVLVSQGGFADPVFGGALSIDPDADGTEDTTGALLLEHEKKVSTIFRDVTQYPAGNVLTLSGTSQWSDYSGGVASVSDPVGNLKLGVQTIHLLTGRWPNTMIIPFDGVGVIENHPRITIRFQNWTMQYADAWKVILGIPEAAGINIFIVDSKFNAANNVDAPEDIQSFWGQDVWLGIVDPSEGQKIKTFAKTFCFPYANNQVRTVDRWREEEKKRDVIRSSYRYDVKVASNVAGFLFKNAVAAIS